MIDEGYIEARESSDPLANVRVSEAMKANPTTISADVTLLDAARAVAGTHHRIYPVVNAEGRFAGVLSRESIESAARENTLDNTVLASTEQPKLIATGDELLIDLVQRMQQNGTDRSPVIDSEESRQVIGFISPSDILRVRLRQTKGEDESPFELFE
jgi:CBS domain-containing protein